MINMATTKEEALRNRDALINALSAGMDIMEKAKQAGRKQVYNEAKIATALNSLSELENALITKKEKTREGAEEKNDG